MAVRVSEEIITELECAELVGVHVKTLQRARRRGDPIFPFVEVGRQIRYSKAVVLSCFEKGNFPVAAEGNASAVMAVRSTIAVPKRRGRPRNRN